MMALILALLTASLALQLYGARRAALAAAALCLMVSAGLFLGEIHSPRDGFSMPWLQVRAAAPARGAVA